MGTTTLSRYALIIGAALLLSGCAGPFGSGSPSFAPQGAVQVAAHAFAGETFTATAIDAPCLLTPGGPEIQFTASGTASGPFPGTFSASGSVFDFAMRNTITFSETFDVQSGSQTFSGSATATTGIKFSGCPRNSKKDFFIVKGAPYEVDRSRGKTEVRYDKLQFSESFH